MTDAVKKLRALEKKLYALQYAMNVIDYDAQTVAPSGSSQGRGEALEQLSAFRYAIIADPGLPALLDQVRAGEHSEQEAAEAAELEKEYRRISCIPAGEYAAFTKLTTNAVSVWEKAKADNDFAAFAPWLEQIVSARRRFAALLDSNRPAYDVYLDQFETGLTMDKCDAFFKELKATITPLVKRIVEEGRAPAAHFLRGPWDAARQSLLADRLMELMHLDRAHCQRGESEHPFTTEFYKGDVRITTHYHEDDLASSLYSVVHEGGHALYELHTADRLMGTVLAGGATMGIHESQSRFFENYIGRSLPFIRCIWPMVTDLFPEKLAGVTPEQFYAAVNTCRPSLIRTEADEVTYCLHIMVRYELEKRLLDGSLAVADLPAAWNALMEELLGVEVPSDSQGVLQDIHWACGDLGYFPSYALGTAYGAQYLDAMKKELDVDQLVAGGDLSPIIRWLDERIWQYGKEKSPEWLLQNACGAPFDPRFFTRYLVEKYTAIYQL